MAASPTALKYKARMLYKEVRSPFLHRSRSLLKMTRSPLPPSTGYFQLSYLAQFYPDPAYNLPKRVKSCFRANLGAEGEKLESGIAKAEFIKKELEALYFLKKYRTMKNRYYG